MTDSRSNSTSMHNGTDQIIHVHMLAGGPRRDRVPPTKQLTKSTPTSNSTAPARPASRMLFINKCVASLDCCRLYRDDIRRRPRADKSAGCKTIMARDPAETTSPSDNPAQKNNAGSTSRRQARPGRCAARSVDLSSDEWGGWAN